VGAGRIEHGMTGRRTKAERLEHASAVIRAEARTIANLEECLGGAFCEAVDLVMACAGQLVVTGMGKAGIIGQKISATFASTGTPSLFLHPAEALHGDLGRIRSVDLLLAISNSGETSEVNACIAPARKIGAGVIALTGRPDSTLGRLADCILDIGRVEEACPMKLAPTASTSAMLALGDALAMVVLDERDFDREDYALFHPSGSLGRQLMRVREVMRSGAELPLVATGTPVTQALLTMTKTPGKPGAALVTVSGTAADPLLGIFTDGDLRRLLELGGAAQLDGPIDEFMARDPKSIGPEQLVEEAQHTLREYRVDQIPVLDEARRPVGLIDVQDLLDIRI